MTRDLRTLKVCNCNRTMPLDGRALGAALGGDALAIHTELCRKEIAAFETAAKAGDCIVACTQEAPLFGEVAETLGARGELRFVNIREAAGWSAEGARATPKIAALLAAAELPEPDPVSSVSYRSQGQLLVIGPAAAAVPWAQRLAASLDVAVLITDAKGGDLPVERRYPVWSGRVSSVAGWLGAFEVEWEQANPIDLDVCTRCNACVRACPEQAIDFTYQIDLSRCTGHRECVKACGPVRAIDFDRADTKRSERFDLVLDLSETPTLKVARKPYGYLAPGRDPVEQALAAAEIATLVGEFEKPKYFAYEQRICAHGRSGKTGCTACVDTCSTGAIASRGDHVVVEPHLCLGCGGCATVCPSGAMTYQNPRVPDVGMRLKRLMSVYREAGGADALVLFHGEQTGGVLAALARRGRGLPARVIPVQVYHPASVGIDTLLGALAYGASQAMVLASEAEHDEYGAAIERQMGYAQAILSGLGYAGRHLHLARADAPGAVETTLWELAPAATVAKPATFNLASAKRTTFDFLIDHLARHAPVRPDAIPLPAGAPFGAVAIDKAKCTLCMACVGACPASALLDGRDRPMLKLIERNCVQCGLCANTCPEDAVRLVPRLALVPEAKQEVTLNEAEPFNCVRCGKPFGTRQMIDGMLGRLATHSMFSGAGALRRLQMCADCRVVDMIENKDEVSIFDVKPR